MIEKVREDYNCQMFQCQRCKSEADSDGWYCNDCIGSAEVDFDIIENGVNLKGDDVCPWCYNQLVDIKNKELKNDNKNTKN